MIFGKRGFVYRLILIHCAQTFSLSYFLRLIATAIGSYHRSRRTAQERNSAGGGQVLRRIYGHIVAQGIGAEKLPLSLAVSAVPRRNFRPASQVAMALVIVLLAWTSWPERASAPMLAAAPLQSATIQKIVPLAVDAQTVPEPAQASAVNPENTSSLQITTTKERFAALATLRDRIDNSATLLPPAPADFGSEVEDSSVLSADSVETGESGSPAVETLSVETLTAEALTEEPLTEEVLTAGSFADEPSNTPSRPSGLANLLASLAEVTVGSRAAVSQIVAEVGDLAAGAGRSSRTVVEAQPTSTPSSSSSVATPGSVPVLVPGSVWADFTPAASPAVDHFWLGQPHPSGYNQLYSPNYQFGSTANERYRIHHGVDVASDAGTPVLAMGEGEVVHAGPDNPTLLGPYNNFYGNAVVVRLNRRLPTPEGDQDVYVLLGHLSAVYVERGQQVTPEVTVGAVGMTGIAIGPHLHVEVRVGQNSYLHSVNPALWMRNPSGAGSVAARVLTADGRSWSDARLSLLRYEGGGTRWVRTIEIYPNAENISADPAWGENGALSQLAAGAYWIGGVINGEKFGQNLTIYPGETTFVELRTQQ